MHSATFLDEIAAAVLVFQRLFAGRSAASTAWRPIMPEPEL
jgi:hypothetical protein